MGRMLPIECEHGVVLDWGDFGPCQDCRDHSGSGCPNLNGACFKCEFSQRINSSTFKRLQRRWATRTEAMKLCRSIADEGVEAVLGDDFYRCPNTGEWVYKWADERLVLTVDDDESEPVADTTKASTE